MKVKIEGPPSETSIFYWHRTGIDANPRYSTHKKNTEVAKSRASASFSPSKRKPPKSTKGNGFGFWGVTTLNVLNLLTCPRMKKFILGLASCIQAAMIRMFLCFSLPVHGFPLNAPKFREEHHHE